MIYGGDEFGRTQFGNNNPYCQDNEITWTNWDLDQDQQAFLAFTRRLIEIRRHPVLHRRKFFQGKPICGSEMKDITWFSCKGHEMADAEWQDVSCKCIGFRLAGDATSEQDILGDRIIGDTLLILMNSGTEARPFVLPTHGDPIAWRTILNTADPALDQSGPILQGGMAYPLQSHSLVVFQLA